MRQEVIADQLSRQALTEVVSGVLGAPARLRGVQEAAPVPQGASGGVVRAYTVHAEGVDGSPRTVKVISKEASSRERHVLALLSTQRQAIPVTWVEDLGSAGRARIFQEYADAYPWDTPESSLTEQTAEALAAIHVANLGATPAWLPRADRAFVEALYLQATQREWVRNLADPAFAGEFGRYTEPLQAALDRLLGVLDELTREGQTLTLINTDITPEHLRLARGKPCIIDWNQAHLRNPDNCILNGPADPIPFPLAHRNGRGGRG